MPTAINSFSVSQHVSLADALAHFASYSGPTQSQQHIKPFHWYVASRLVLEGGFHPDDITPHPPFSVDYSSAGAMLRFDPSVATGSERTILGGLKTKNVDVVVAKDGIGPVLAVSCKGMTGALRNLTNRMEETIGECTNLHITHPAMVFGYLFVIRANRQIGVQEQLGTYGSAPVTQLPANDIALASGGEPVEAVMRFHKAMEEMAGRKGLRNELSRYEAVSLLLVDPTEGENQGKPLPDFPPHTSRVRFDSFFQTLYLRYEERFVLSAPDLARQRRRLSTRRIEWAPQSPALTSGQVCASLGDLDYLVRTATQSSELDDSSPT